MGQPRQKYKKLSNFTGLQTHAGVSAKSHAVQRGTKQAKQPQPLKDKHRKLWYAKQVDDEISAVAEVVAQEFFRLMMPYQPKTRLGKDDENNVSVLSQQAPKGYQDLVSLSREELKSGLNGEYQGLGRVLATAHFLQETDLKLGNLGRDTENRIIKIDGDWCFSRLRHPGYNKGTITAGDIARMPLIVDYRGWNWLDVQSEGRLYTSTLFDNNFPNNADFRKDLNYGMLQILLVPESVLADFVESYTDNEELAELLFKEMFDRNEQLKSAALQNPDFQKFLLSEEAKICMNDYLQNVENFKTMGKNFLITNKEFSRQYTEGIFAGLQKAARLALPPSVPLPMFNPPKARVQYSDLEYAEALFNDIQTDNYDVRNNAEFSIYMCKFTKNLLDQQGIIDYSIVFDKNDNSYQVQGGGITVHSFTVEDFKNIVDRAKERYKETGIENLAARRPQI